MAYFYPSLTKIRSDMMEHPTEGELALLEELQKLSDDFQVYFQPHINFAHPDIIILHQTGGALIIEVKDWNFSSYSYYPGNEDDDYGYLKVTGESGRISTPFHQVQEYKDELFRTLCPELVTESLRLGPQGRNVYGVIKTAIYFHNATANSVANLFITSGQLSKHDGFKKYKSYTSYWCREDLPSLTSGIRQLMAPHHYFTQVLYNSMQAFLVPSDSWMEQMTPFDLGELDEQQKALSQCVPGSWTRIKGTAGSGKTMIIAQSAINCYRQKKTPVLILTYNITLRNYIRDRIAQNTRDMSQRERSIAFEILHFDAFLPQVLRKMELKAPHPRMFKSIDGKTIRWEDYHKAIGEILEQEQSRIIEYGCKYDTVLIDEAQDYERTWFELIEKYFLADEAEFLVVADEKQNLYERQLENKLPIVPGFHGPWRKLSKSYRLSQATFSLASDFQKTFMGNKYDLDLSETINASTNKGLIRYFRLSSVDDDLGKTWEIINQFRTTGEFTSPNDICILLNDISSIRALEQKISINNPGIKVITMCETQDEYNALIDQKRQGIVTDLDYELDRIRNTRKYRFNMNSGTIKICTIHSFKGWEISTIVLVLGNESINDELVYTAITRAKQNIIVVNFGNDKYHSFFSEHDTSYHKDEIEHTEERHTEESHDPSDYVRSDSPTEYVYSDKDGVGHIDKIDGSVYNITFFNGNKAATMNFDHFYRQGKVYYVKPISKEAKSIKSSRHSTSQKEVQFASNNEKVQSVVFSHPDDAVMSPSPEHNNDLQSHKPEKRRIDIKNIAVQVMIEPTEQKKMFTYLSVHRPELIEEAPDPESSAQYVIEHVFPRSLNNPCIVSNYSYTSEATGRTIQEFAIRSVNSSYLQKRLDEKDLQLKIHGLVNPSNVLRIKDIEVVSQSECADNEMQYDLRFIYPIENPRMKVRNALIELAEGLPSYVRTKEDELALWTDYIDWKQRLAEIKVFGIKYIDYKIVETSNSTVRLHFLTVMPDEISCSRLLRLARKERDQVSVFSSAISKDKWEFVYNPEAKANIQVDLRLVKITQIDLSAWEPDINNTSSTLGPSLKEIEAKDDIYSAPCYAEAVFDVPEEYEEHFAEREFTLDQMLEYVETKLAKYIQPDGYIATSRVGDFSLNKRLKDALTSLRTGHAVSGNLGNWLFDITQAHEAERTTEIGTIEWSPWGKKHLNGSQKEVVRRMLDAPEVFLCQGPPGTGKTTVIAEVVYQLVLRKKRVLIASQTNLAVNNALSKLLGYPGIRAIRLGGQGKIDNSVEHITEENIIKTFYGNVRRHLQEQYFNKWNGIDADSCEQKQDAERYSLLIGQEKKATGLRMSCRNKLQSIRKQIVHYNEKNDLDDVDGDLSIIELAIATITGMNMPTIIQLDMNPTDLILTGITGYLSEFQKAGYNFDSENSSDFAISEMSKRKKLSLVRSVIRFLSYISTALDTPQETSINREEELLDLQRKRQALLDSPLSDYESFVQLKKINEQIELFGKANKGIMPNRCPESVTDCLPDSIKHRIEEEGLSPNILQKIRLDIGTLVNRCLQYTVKCLCAVQKNKNETDAADKTTADKIVDAASALIGKVFDTYQEAETAVLELQKLADKYNCHVSQLHETFQSINKSLQKKNSKVMAERKEYEEFFTDLMARIDQLDDESQYKLENEIYQTPFINACNVVGVSCTERPQTLSGKGFDKFDVIIIDEVSKATPPEMLIPLLLAEKAILVGDHRQLPPLFNEHYNSYQELKTAIDADAEDNLILTDENYSKFESLVTNSLFKRHYEQAGSGNKGALLVQYRMHREIMAVVNQFYNGQLQSGWSQEEEAVEKRHYLTVTNSSGTIPLITPDHHAYWIDSTFLHGKPVYEKQEGSSKVNLLEAVIITQLIKRIDESYSAQGFERIEVGVISFYGRQVGVIKKMLSKIALKCVKCDVNTVDRFQGKEKPIVIVSLVRSVEPGKPYDASYVKAFQRMNVAFSRAQTLLIMIGSQEMYTHQDIVIEDMENGQKLPPKKVYKDIIQHLEMEGCRFTADELLDVVADKEVFAKD